MDGYTDRFYAVLTFWVHEEAILQVEDNGNHQKEFPKRHVIKETMLSVNNHPLGCHSYHLSLVLLFWWKWTFVLVRIAFIDLLYYNCFYNFLPVNLSLLEASMYNRMNKKDCHRSLKQIYFGEMFDQKFIGCAIQVYQRVLKVKTQ